MSKRKRQRDGGPAQQPVLVDAEARTDDTDPELDELETDAPDEAEADESPDTDTEAPAQQTEPPAEDGVQTSAQPVDVDSPAAKAAHCAKCDRRFVPVDGPVCGECVAAETTRRDTRPGYAWCKVLEHVVACGVVVDGHVRTTFEPGEVAQFSAEDITSLPGHFEPVDEG